MTYMRDVQGLDKSYCIVKSKFYYANRFNHLNKLVQKIKSEIFSKLENFLLFDF